MTLLENPRVLLCAITIVLAACGGGGAYDPAPAPDPNPPVAGASYVATVLVADVGTTGNTRTDPHLSNSWGIAITEDAFAWVTNNGNSSSTQYDGAGIVVPLAVSMPAGRAGAFRPTGVAFNDSDNFTITRGTLSGKCTFIAVGEGGTVSCWVPGVSAAEGATLVVDGASAGAVYKGAAIASRSDQSFLYAADFHNRAVDVFDGSFTKVAPAGGFVDTALPGGYAPFGIQSIGQLIYVAYARRDAASDTEITGDGLGLVNVFDMAGNLIRRLIPAGGKLNAPWGMARAPANFGIFRQTLLVANSGDGKINAFAPSGAFLGSLSQPDGAPIVIDGLRGIAIGGGGISDPPSLYYVAGPGRGQHGSFGRIDVH